MFFQSDFFKVQRKLVSLCDSICALKSVQ